MKLPNSRMAIVSEDRVRDYLLSHESVVSRLKAVLFEGLGYRQDEWPRLQADLKKFLEFDATESEVAAFGRRYSIRGQLTGPGGQSLDLVTAWIVLQGEDIPRFVTAYPGDSACP